MGEELQNGRNGTQCRQPASQQKSISPIKIYVRLHYKHSNELQVLSSVSAASLQTAQRRSRRTPDHRARLVDRSVPPIHPSCYCCYCRTVIHSINEFPRLACDCVPPPPPRGTTHSRPPALVAQKEYLLLLGNMHGTLIISSRNLHSPVLR